MRAKLGSGAIVAAVVVAIVLSAPSPGRAQEAEANNQIVLSKDVVGPVPASTVFSFVVQCTAIDAPAGGPLGLPGVDVVDETVQFDAAGNPDELSIEVPVVTDSNEGFVLCSIGESPAPANAVLAAPTFEIVDPGTERAVGPPNDVGITGGPVGFTGTAQFSYTRSGAVVAITFTNTYPAAPSPVLVAPALTG